jgi:hypothetical protein
MDLIIERWLKNKNNHPGTEKDIDALAAPNATNWLWAEGSALIIFPGGPPIPQANQEAMNKNIYPNILNRRVLRMF